MQEIRITDNLDALFDVLPPSIVESLKRIEQFNELIEVVMDLGRPPESRYAGEHAGEQILRNEEVTTDDIEYVLSRISEFDADNRAGIARTLHRISAIRNRRNEVVGLTCRVGRAVYGTLGIIEDIIMSGKSILLLGRPGIGKTTMLREAARVLAESRRVVIVDTSNEIGGDGDIPHPAVGRARRMQVAKPSLQHEVMIEAVENHNPQVIVIDEIGRAAEAEAARTIAERGVQLIGTAHGQTIENLMANPTLSDLVGGIESVTLSDEEARRRGTQKTVLERRAPPTFDVLIEIQDRHRLLVHPDVGQAVDALLRGKAPMAELRYYDETGAVQIEKVRRAQASGARIESVEWQARPLQPSFQGGYSAPSESVLSARRPEPDTTRQAEPAPQATSASPESSEAGLPTKLREKTMQLYAFGIPRNRLAQSVRQLGVPAEIVDSLEDADVLITAKAYYRQRPKIISEAEHLNIPIYVLRSNSLTQMENCLADLFSLSSSESTPYEEAIAESEMAVRRVLAGERMVDLSPQNAFIRRQQHEMARAANLVSHSYGKEPYRRVRIFRD
ncbi:MAG: R3H domain-containing nucleic acid-binding protein [Anaerolineae bacterium]|nr:AAA family ATPase [Thermoflexales bacterium]MDW8408496.1 R3H domain-containing nucleic acid-binding protein [Anaerolineae bacterium]